MKKPDYSWQGRCADAVLPAEALERVQFNAWAAHACNFHMTWESYVTGGYCPDDDCDNDVHFPILSNRRKQALRRAATQRKVAQARAVLAEAKRPAVWKPSTPGVWTGARK